MSGAEGSRPASTAPRAAVGAVVLAAGTSSRWGGDRSKQLHPWEGEPLVRRAARIAIESAADEVVVVTGHDARAVEGTLAGLAVRTVHNRDYASGQASSVRTGIAALGGLEGDVEGALFVPCDQPLLDAETLDLLIERFTRLGRERQSRAVVPTHRGRRGAPALIGSDLFGALDALVGDEGGRRVLAAVPDRVVEVELASADPLLDVDTLEDLRALERDHPPRATPASG